MTWEGAADPHTWIFSQNTHILILCNNPKVHVLRGQDLCTVLGRQGQSSQGRTRGSLRSFSRQVQHCCYQLWLPEGAASTSVLRWLQILQPPWELLEGKQRHFPGGFCIPSSAHSRHCNKQLRSIPRAATSPSEGVPAPMVPFPGCRDGSSSSAGIFQCFRG